MIHLQVTIDPTEGRAAKAKLTAIIIEPPMLADPTFDKVFQWMGEAVAALEKDLEGVTIIRPDEEKDEDK